MRHWLVIGALVVVLPGCGMSLPGQGDPVTEPSTAPAAPVSPAQTGANDAQTMQVIARDVAKTYESVQTLSADYGDHQNRGSERYDAVSHLRFAKARRVRLDVKTCTDSLVAGASILWIGGATLTGKKAIGPLNITQVHPLAEKPCLRGWTFDQTDYHAMVQALLAGMPRAHGAGQAVVGGRTLFMVEFPSALKGAAVERIGLDTALRLPVYREVHETANGPVVALWQFHNVVVNPTLAKDAFTL